MTKAERDQAIDLVLGQVRPVVVAAVDAAIGKAEKAAPKAATRKAASPKAEAPKPPAITEAPATSRQTISRHFVAELLEGDAESYGAVRFTRWIDKKGQLIPVKSMTVPEEDLEYVIDILLDAQRRKEARQPVAA